MPQRKSPIIRFNMSNLVHPGLILLGGRDAIDALVGPVFHLCTIPRHPLVRTMYDHDYLNFIP